MNISWLGRTDLRAVTESETIGLGPLVQAVRGLLSDELVLICDYPVAEARTFIAWLHTHKELPTTLKQVTLASPTDFADIYEAAIDVTGLLKKGKSRSAHYIFLAGKLQSSGV